MCAMWNETFIMQVFWIRAAAYCVKLDYMLHKIPKHIRLVSSAYFNHYIPSKRIYEHVQFIFCADSRDGNMFEGTEALKIV